MPQLPLYQYGPAGDAEYIYDDQNFDYRSMGQGDITGEQSVNPSSVTAKKAKVKKASAGHPMFEFLNGVPGLGVKVVGTNATLTWPSSAGNLYLIESEPDLLEGVASGGGVPWTILTNALLAASGTETSFIDPHPVIYPTNISGTNSGGSGPPPPGGSTNSGTGGPVTSTARFYAVYNVTPIAGEPVFAVSQDSSANQLNIFQSAFDPNDGYLFVASLTQPQNGSISYTPDGSTFQYTPNSGFYGIDTFPFTITNSYGGSANGVATIFVTEAGDAGLTANNLILTLATNQYTTNFNAISNSSSPSCVLYAVSTPQYGTIATNAAGQITYTRDANLFGTDSFSYAVTDGSGGYASGTVQVQQMSTMDNGLPDQWQLAYGMDPTQDNSLADPDGDGLPNVAEFMLGSNPLQADNPLNLPTITNGTVLSGYAQLPLVGISVAAQTPSLMLLVNGAPAAKAPIVQGPDGLWAFGWDTSHLSNGLYTIQVEMEYGNSTFGPQYDLYGMQKNIAISNLVTFDSLTSQFTDYGLIFYGTLNGITNAGILVQLSDDHGNPLVYGNFTVTNGQINLYWDLTDGHGNQISFGNVQAMFTITNEDVDPPPANITQWFYREGGAGNASFVVAWGWDSYLAWFNNCRDNMIMGGVVNILVNPADNNPYTMAPCCFWNRWDSPDSMFRYDTDTDKRNLTNALAQSLYFFWQGHAGVSVITGNPDKSNISPAEVQNVLSNFQSQSTQAHPKSNAHPYRLVVLNGCQTDSPMWSQSFGIDYDQVGTTNYVATYNAAGRTPRAFIGWTKENEVPDQRDVECVGSAEYESALGALWSDWMHNAPLNFCLQDFEEVATNYNFTGQGSGHISGCVDLQRNDF